MIWKSEGGNLFAKKAIRYIGIFLAVTLLIIVFGPLLIPFPGIQGTVDEKSLADVDSKFIEANSIVVHYKEEGQGEEAIILLHGFGASTFSWRNNMVPLSLFGRVIAYDRPAFGLTSRPMPGDWNGISPYGIESQVELLVSLMDELDVRIATLVGHSAGAAVAVHTALKYPERVAQLVLIAPALFGNRSFPSWMQPILAAHQMRWYGPLLVRSIAETGKNTIELAWHNPDKITPPVIDGYTNPLQANNWDRALYEFTISNRSSEYGTRLSEISQPVLVITGDDDRLIPLSSSREVAESIPGVVLVVIPGCGHVIHEECPQAFYDSFQEFMQAQEK